MSKLKENGHTYEIRESDTHIEKIGRNPVIAWDQATVEAPVGSLAVLTGSVADFDGEPVSEDGILEYDLNYGLSSHTAEILLGVVTLKFSSSIPISFPVRTMNHDSPVVTVRFV